MRFAAFGLVLVLAAGALACEREEVEVAESDAAANGDSLDGGAPAPLFPTDASVDARLANCGPPPAIGRCAPPACPNGNVVLADGSVTCECCP